jgi:YesN/AraC family two-component response regulator
MNKTLLLVDDEEAVLHSLVRLFRNQGYQLLTAVSGAEALRLLENNEVQVILSDQRMPEMTGVEMLTVVRERYPEIIRMVLSGYSDISAISDAVNKGNHLQISVQAVGQRSVAGKHPRCLRTL